MCFLIQREFPKYFDVELNYTWDTVKIDLPKLKRELNKILQMID